MLSLLCSYRNLFLQLCNFRITHKERSPQIVQNQSRENQIRHIHRIHFKLLKTVIQNKVKVTFTDGNSGDHEISSFLFVTVPERNMKLVWKFFTDNNCRSICPTWQFSFPISTFNIIYRCIIHFVRIFMQFD